MKSLVLVIPLVMLSGLAQAADESASRRVDEAFAASSIEWSGLYAGIAAGYLSTGGTGGSSGIAGSVFAGYNWQMQDTVAGVEAGFTAADADVAAGQQFPGIFDVRGRLGYSFGNIMVYGTGGGALVPRGAGEPTATGLAAGAGIDWNAVGNTAWGLQYLHYRFNDFRNTGNTLELDLVQGRLSYKF